MAIFILKQYLLLLAICAPISRTACSLFDPHLFPEKGPFFEGWYLRVSDFDNLDSFGLLFGSVLPPSAVNVTGPLVLASVLMRKCETGSESSCKLTSADASFDTSNLNITVKDQHVSKDPDKKSPADFNWEVNKDNQGGYFKQQGDTTDFNFRIKDLSIKGQANAVYPWNVDGSGPEGWLGNLPLPLHWFVFSLRSNLIFYEIQNITSGAVTKGKNGVIHLEKNWGKSFPEKWIWSEGVSRDSSNISFAISGGLVDFTVMSVDAYLIGYRNPSTNLALDFRPDNSIVKSEIDGCTGSVNMTIQSWLYKIEIRLFASLKTTSSCLLGPETRGFMRACVESYDAFASFTVSKRIWFLEYKLIEKQVFENVALEFGGNYVCGNKCLKT